MGTYIQAVKLSPIMKTWKCLIFLRVQLFSTHRCCMISPPYPSSAKPCRPLFQQILVQTEFSPMSLIAITLNKVFSCVLLFDAIFALTEGTFRLCKYPILHQTFNLFIFVFVSLWTLIFIFCSICILYFDGQNIPDPVVKVTL